MEVDRTVSALESCERRLSAQTISGDDVSHAFDALIDAWRSLRAVELADLCETFSVRVGSNVAVKGLGSSGTQQDRMVAWASAFREHSPLGLAPLLLDFEASVKGNAQPRFVFPRADALSTVRDDPRIAPVILRALGVIAGGSKWQKVLLRYFRALEAAGDPRAIDGLSHALDQGGQGLSKSLVGGLRDFALERGPDTLRGLKERFAEGTPLLPSSLDSLVRSIKTRINALDPKLELEARRAAKNAQLGDPASLLRDVYESPDDPAARLVLADALMERGDPRGELIALQMRRADGESTPRTIAREKALLKANMRTWLGPLAAVVSLKSAVFESGFLTRCEATATSRAMAELHFHHPEWATVRCVEFRGSPLITPAMKSLREASTLDDFALLKLRAMGGHPHLERLGVSVGNDSATHDALVTTPLPSLRHLALSLWARAKDLAWIWRAPWAEQLSTLEVSSSEDLSEWIPMFGSKPALQEIRFHPHGETTTRMTRVDGGVGIAIKHRATNWVDSAPPFMIRNLREAIDRLNGSPLVRELSIEANGEKPNDAQRAEIENSLGKLTQRRSTNLPW